MHSLLIFCMIGLMTLTACTPAPTYQKIEGQTMGTSYHITFYSPNPLDKTALQAQVDARLHAINQSMSTYDDTATIMAFNRADKDTPIAIDDDFVQVFNDSQQIYQDSNGAFDPTVKPLIDLWGFGKTLTLERLNAPPSQKEITDVYGYIGLDKITLNGNILQKSNDNVALDFSAIAKGYGVDVVADTLKAQGVTDYMVEIGGEVATLGQNAKGKPWQLAIDTPTPNSTASNRTILTTITGNKLNMATSGNYRNQLEWQGVSYSHTINPLTAHPVADGAPSVTVLHDTTALADGWATALTALPQTDAIALAERMGIKALFILKDNDGWQITQTKAMQAFREQSP